jgi:RNA methyltransferase, TrmH family
MLFSPDRTYLAQRQITPAKKDVKREECRPVTTTPEKLTSLQNARVKQVVKLGKRPARDEAGLLLVEGYRELTRALDNRWPPSVLYYCPSLFLGQNEPALIERAREAGAELCECTEPVFCKMAYRDRPEGLLAVGPQVRANLGDLLIATPAPLIVVAEAIEKPGNLGTILRTADAAGVHAVIVCDQCTDVNNPNVVRASIGTLFALPVVEASSEDALEWLRARHMQIVAATPHGEMEYTQADLSRGTAVVVGSEQLGLSERWMKSADLRVRIPMLGQADSLNVAAATTILLYEAVRQRRKKA